MGKKSKNPRKNAKAAARATKKTPAAATNPPPAAATTIGTMVNSSPSSPVTATASTVSAVLYPLVTGIYSLLTKIMKDIFEANLGKPDKEHLLRLPAIRDYVEDGMYCVDQCRGAIALTHHAHQARLLDEEAHSYYEGKVDKKFVAKMKILFARTISEFDPCITCICSLTHHFYNAMNELQYCGDQITKEEVRKLERHVEGLYNVALNLPKSLDEAIKKENKGWLKLTRKMYPEDSSKYYQPETIQEAFLGPGASLHPDAPNLIRLPTHGGDVPSPSSTQTQANAAAVPPTTPAAATLTGNSIQVGKDSPSSIATVSTITAATKTKSDDTPTKMTTKTKIDAAKIDAAAAAAATMALQKKKKAAPETPGGATVSTASTSNSDTTGSTANSTVTTGSAPAALDMKKVAATPGGGGTVSTASSSDSDTTTGSPNSGIVVAGGPSGIEDHPNTSAATSNEASEM